MKVINRFFFVLALLAFIFSDVRAELRFDDYRYQKYTSEDSIVHKIRMEVDKSAFYVYYYDIPCCEQYLYEKYGIVNFYWQRMLGFWNGNQWVYFSASQRAGSAGVKSDVPILEAAFSVNPEHYEEVWEALRQDSLHIYSVQTVRMKQNGSYRGMKNRLYAHTTIESERDRVMHIADSLNLFYVGLTFGLSGYYEFEATSQSMYDACTCANVIYEETGIYTQPSSWQNLPHSSAGVYFMADGLKYLVTSDSTCMLISAAYYSGSIYIPEKVEYGSREYTVSAIEDKAFACCDSLTSVSLPSSLISIGNFAFFSCSALKSLSLPPALTSLGRWAFFGCESIESSISIPDGVDTIPEEAFGRCRSLKEVILPTNLEYIGDAAFRECESLSSIILPEGLETIGSSAFTDCKSLTYVAITEGVDTICVLTFAGCVSLSKVILPQSMSFIENGAFCDDDSLTDVVNLSPKPQKIIDDSYYDTFPSRFHATLHVPAGCAEAYRSAEVWCDFANIVEDAATSVNRISADDGLPGDAPWFDLTGRRVDNPASGIYISNGRKVLHGG